MNAAEFLQAVLIGLVVYGIVIGVGVSAVFMTIDNYRRKHENGKH